MKVYYAHSLNIYNSMQEDRDVDTLKCLNFEVLNPNQSVYEAEYHKRGFDVFYELIDECDILAFRSTPDGSITAGVSKEIQYAREKGKPVIELPSSIVKRSLSVDETREYLSELR